MCPWREYFSILLPRLADFQEGGENLGIFLAFMGDEKFSQSFSFPLGGKRDEKVREAM